MFSANDLAKLPLSKIFSWPVFILILIGLLTVVSSIGFLVYFLVSHLRIV